jgi:hypothetical protein
VFNRQLARNATLRYHLKKKRIGQVSQDT